MPLRVNMIGLGLVGSAAVLLLPWLASDYYVTVATLSMIYGMLAVSLDLLHGYTGIESLGHAAFFGTGAYAVGMAFKYGVAHSLGFVGLLAAGVAASVLLATLVGLLVVRTRGLYTLMVLLAAGMMVWGVAVQWRSVSGGDDGLAGIVRPVIGIGMWVVDLGNRTAFYYATLVLLVGAVGWLRLLIRSPFGYSLVGIRENERRMRVLGYTVWFHKYIAVMVAAGVAGLSGALHALYQGVVSPVDLHLVQSAEALVMVVLGGAGTLIGPIMGAVMVTVVKNLVSAYTEYWSAALGFGFVAVVAFAPAGIYPWLRARFRGKRGGAWRRSHDGGVA